MDASEEEQRELRMLRAGGILPAGSSSTTSPAAGQPPAASSPLPAGNRAPPESPPFLEGLKVALKKLPFLMKNAKAASEARRRRRGGKGGARVGGAMRASPDSIGASSSGDRKDGGTTIDADLALALRLQEEENAIGLEAQHVTRRQAGRADNAADLEIGERGSSRRAGLGVEPVERVVDTAVVAGGGKSTGDRLRGQDGGSSGSHLGRASQEWTSLKPRAVHAAAGAGLEFSHSNRLYRSGSGGGSGLGFQRLDDTGEGGSNNSPGDLFGRTARESAL